MDLILSDAGGGQLDLLTYDSAGNLADVDGTNAPTIAITDSAGASVTGFTPSRPSPGTYKATLPANMETLDRFDAAWTWPNGQTRRSQFEIVRRFLFTQVDLRAFDSTLANETKYLDATLVQIRDEVTERFAQIAGVSFIPRGARETLDGDGTSVLFLQNVECSALISVTVGGTALTSTELAKVKLHPNGTLEYDGGVFAEGIRNVVVFYEHGWKTPPLPVVRVAKKFARHLLLNAVMDQSERATAVFNEIGGYRLTIAGRDGPTGLPEIDAVLSPDQYGRARVGFA